MKKQLFKLSDLLQLEVELLGITNNETNEVMFTGLLNQELTMSTKYWLSELVEVVQKEKKAINALREELIKKYGEEDETGVIGIPYSIASDEVDADGNPVMIANPKAIAFQKEYSELISQEKTIRVPKFELDTLKDIKSKETYPLVMKYLIEKPVIDLQDEQ
jgi:uncharacterized membrane protein YheB (UPF0754 family)